jgi:hypothetical protein
MIDFTTLRERLLPTDVEPLRQRNLLIEESHRRRPRYFDGRFLAARDLTRDQAYFLSRQAAYARALGTGVVEGLAVQRGARADEIQVTPGLGYTAGGELVSLQRLVTVSLADMPRLQALNTRLRQDRFAKPPLRNRTGTFALVLRPLEFTANPVSAYPSGLSQERVVEPGDIVEASALELVPLNEGNPAQLDATRVFLARNLFVNGGQLDLPPEVLPLAVVALVGDKLRWIDMHLLRRQAGQQHADVLGFGFAPRLLREAHLAQYRTRLDELRGRRFAATEFFEALPPAGPLPDEAIDAGDFSQHFFPAGIDPELSLVPEDELPAIVEASMSLPPLDLTEPANGQAFTRVSLLIPLPRARLAQAAAELAGQVNRIPPPLRFVGLGAGKRLPVDRLRDLLDPFPVRPVFDPALTTDRAWRSALEAARGRLWYTRQRNLQISDAVLGRRVRLVPQQDNLEDLLGGRLRDFGMLTRFRDIATRTDLLTRADLTQWLASDAFNSPLMLGAALAKLDAAAPEKFGATELATVSSELAQSAQGGGLARLAELKPDLVTDKTAVAKLLADGQVLQLDKHLGGASSGEVLRVADALVAASGGRSIDVAAILKRPR